jgi:hypothetical protein
MASLACCAYAAAILVATFPSPQQLRLAKAPTPDDADVVASIDHAAVAVASAGTWLYGISWPVRAVHATFVRAGLGQNWNMFSTPATFDEYIRLEYVVQNSRQPRLERRLVELVFPAHPEGEVRLWHRYRDKALHATLEAFLAARISSNPALAGRHFDPVIRYFTGRLGAPSISADEVVVQTRVWYGKAENPAPGSTPNPDLARRRTQLLHGYGSGPVEPHHLGRRPPDLGGQQTEQDIVWSLLYVAAP